METLSEEFRSVAMKFNEFETCQNMEKVETFRILRLSRIQYQEENKRLLKKESGKSITQ